MNIKNYLALAREVIIDPNSQPLTEFNDVLEENDIPRIGYQYGWFLISSGLYGYNQKFGIFTSLLALEKWLTDAVNYPFEENSKKSKPQPFFIRKSVGNEHESHKQEIRYIVIGTYTDAFNDCYEEEYENYTAYKRPLNEMYQILLG